MRPIDGGKPEDCFVGSGYAFEPKFNGWRALLHVESGKLFDRHKKQLSITKEFKEAIESARALFLGERQWVDAEGLNNRHSIGKGTLIVLDTMGAGDYDTRRKHLVSKQICILDFTKPIQERFLYATPAWPAELVCVGTACAELKATNKNLGAEVYEGCVLKKRASLYKVEVTARENANWIKHRF